MTKQIQSNETVFVQSAMNMRTESEYVYELKAANSSSKKKEYWKRLTHPKMTCYNKFDVFFFASFLYFNSFAGHLHSSVSCWTFFFVLFSSMECHIKCKNPFPSVVVTSSFFFHRRIKWTRIPFHELISSNLDVTLFSVFCLVVICHLLVVSNLLALALYVLISILNKCFPRFGRWPSNTIGIVTMSNQNHPNELCFQLF